MDIQSWFTKFPVWISLQQEVILEAGEKALELGLLFGTEIRQGEELDVLCFQHLMLQEFAAGVFVSIQDKVCVSATAFMCVPHFYFATLILLHRSNS